MSYPPDMDKLDLHDGSVCARCANLDHARCDGRRDQPDPEPCACAAAVHDESRFPRPSPGGWERET